MEFRTIVDIRKPDFQIEPLEQLLFVGSCFADSIGKRFADEHFPVVVNPYGVMYNPASVLHTLQRWEGDVPRVVFLTLGTNHVYRLRESGEIVDNCQKRPQNLFLEQELTVGECTDFLLQAVDELQQRRPDVRVVVTVSPIRYAKYGFHGSSDPVPAISRLTRSCRTSCATIVSTSRICFILLLRPWNISGNDSPSCISAPWPSSSCRTGNLSRLRCIISRSARRVRTTSRSSYKLRKKKRHLSRIIIIWYSFFFIDSYQDMLRSLHIKRKKSLKSLVVCCKVRTFAPAFGTRSAGSTKGKSSLKDLHRQK